MMTNAESPAPQPPNPPQSGDSSLSTAIVKLPTKITIDIGEFMPRIIELANAECRSPEQQVRYMFKRFLGSWDSRNQNIASFADFSSSNYTPLTKRYFSFEDI